VTWTHRVTFVAVAFADVVVVEVGVAAAAAAAVGLIDYYHPAYRPRPYSNPDPTCPCYSEELKQEIKSAEHPQTIQ
jgi:hypothetical protein